MNANAGTDGTERILVLVRRNNGTLDRNATRMLAERLRHRGEHVVRYVPPQHICYSAECFDQLARRIHVHLFVIVTLQKVDSDGYYITSVIYSINERLPYQQSNVSQQDELATQIGDTVDRLFSSYLQRKRKAESPSSSKADLP